MVYFHRNRWYTFTETGGILSPKYPQLLTNETDLVKLDINSILKIDDLIELNKHFKNKYKQFSLFQSEKYDKFKLLEPLNISQVGFVNPYKFNPHSNYSGIFKSLILNTPNGDNLFWILSQNELLQEEFANYLKEYNLELVYVEYKDNYLIQKKSNKNRVVQIPYSMIADTLQRIIFYTAAIYSNENSILLFEEPEVNSFPPYIRELANKILLSKSNQFFITTHSPYLLTTLLEDSGNEVMLNVVGYKDGKTVIHQISKDEVKELLSYDSDIFLNIDRYI